MSQFYTLLTDTGQAKVANAVALGSQIEITQMAVGDGGGRSVTPDASATTLTHEVRRAPINRIEVDADNSAWVVVEQVLPPDVGGWTIREVGIFDAAGDLIAIGNLPETYKPVLSEGSSRTQTIRVVIEVSDTAAVTLKVDPSVVLATREYVDDSINKHEQNRKATLAEAKAGIADKYPDAAVMKSAISASRSGDQFGLYDGSRTYKAGEIVRGSDGRFYEFYDRDLAGAVKGVDPAESTNRPHIWMEWHGVRPGSVIEWRSETLPEGYVENDGATISRSAYRRVFDALGTNYGAGDGSTTFRLPDDRGEFKRGWDHGRGVDSERALSAHQMDAMRNLTGGASFGDNINNTGALVHSETGVFTGQSANGVWYQDYDSNGSSGLNRQRLLFDASRQVPVANEFRPRNLAVIYLTKI